MTAGDFDIHTTPPQLAPTPNPQPTPGLEVYWRTPARELTEQANPANFRLYFGKSLKSCQSKSHNGRILAVLLFAGWLPRGGRNAKLLDLASTVDAINAIASRQAAATSVRNNSTTSRRLFAFAETLSATFSTSPADRILKLAASLKPLTFRDTASEPADA